MLSLGARDGVKEEVLSLDTLLALVAQRLGLQQPSQQPPQPPPSGTHHHQQYDTPLLTGDGTLIEREATSVTPVPVALALDDGSFTPSAPSSVPLAPFSAPSASGGGEALSLEGSQQLGGPVGEGSASAPHVGSKDPDLDLVQPGSLGAEGGAAGPRRRRWLPSEMAEEGRPAEAGSSEASGPDEPPAAVVGAGGSKHSDAGGGHPQRKKWAAAAGDPSSVDGTVSAPEVGPAPCGLPAPAHQTNSTEVAAHHVTLGVGDDEVHTREDTHTGTPSLALTTPSAAAFAAAASASPEDGTSVFAGNKRALTSPLLGLLLGVSVTDSLFGSDSQQLEAPLGSAAEMETNKADFRFAVQAGDGAWRIAEDWRGAGGWGASSAAIPRTAFSTGAAFSSVDGDSAATSGASASSSGDRPHQTGGGGTMDVNGTTTGGDGDGDGVVGEGSWESGRGAQPLLFVHWDNTER